MLQTGHCHLQLRRDIVSREPQFHIPGLNAVVRRANGQFCKNIAADLGLKCTIEPRCSVEKIKGENLCLSYAMSSSHSLCYARQYSRFFRNVQVNPKENSRASLGPVLTKGTHCGSKWQ